MVTYKLFVERNLVKLQLVNSGRGVAQQHRGCEQGGGLHDW